MHLTKYDIERVNLGKEVHDLYKSIKLGSGQLPSFTDNKFKEQVNLVLEHHARCECYMLSKTYLQDILYKLRELSLGLSCKKTIVIDELLKVFDHKGSLDYNEVKDLLEQAYDKGRLYDD